MVLLDTTAKEYSRHSHNNNITGFRMVPQLQVAVVYTIASIFQPHINVSLIYRCLKSNTSHQHIGKSRCPAVLIARCYYRGRRKKESHRTGTVDERIPVRSIVSIMHL